MALSRRQEPECAIERIICKTKSGRMVREPFLQLLETVSGLSSDDRKKYAKLFVREKIRDVGQLSKLDVSGLKAMGIPMGDAVEILDAVMRFSNSRLLEESVSSMSLSSDDVTAEHVVIPELPEGLEFYAFASHNWGSPETGFANHNRVNRFVEKLRASGVSIWFDHDRLAGDIEKQVTSGIDHSATFVAFITKDYVEKVLSGSDADKTDWCHYEFGYAGLQKPNKMIAVVLDSDMLDTKKWKGAVGARLGTKIFVDFTNDDKIENACLDLCRVVTGML